MKEIPYVDAWGNVWMAGKLIQRGLGRRVLIPRSFRSLSAARKYVRTMAARKYVRTMAAGAAVVAPRVARAAPRVALSVARRHPAAVALTAGLAISRLARRPDLGVPGPGVLRPRDLTPTTHGVPVKQWVANGVVFQRNEDGTITVQRKDGTIKTFRPHKPVVFGKRVDAAKFARLAKKYRKVYRELHKLFGKKSCRRRC